MRQATDHINFMELFPFHMRARLISKEMEQSIITVVETQTDFAMLNQLWLLAKMRGFYFLKKFG